MISWISGLDERVDFVLPQYLVVETSGLGGSPVQLQTLQGLGQSGVTLVDQLLEPRKLNLIILVEGSSRGEVEGKRRKLLRLFNAKFLEVNSKIGEKEISLITTNDEGVNYFKVLTPGSEFITLAPGVNELTCNLIDGQVEVAYYNRYLGI